MADCTFRVPGAAWKHRFDESLECVRKQAAPGPLEIIKMLPMIGRLMQFTRESRECGFDPVSVSAGGKVDPYNGVPLGGIGCGSIGRGWRGDFRRWQLRPGTVLDAPVMADQFSLFVQREGEAPLAQVLFPGEPADGSLSAWQWSLPAETARYDALFPRAWTEYENPLPGIRLVCRQLSPVIAHNYRESSLPVSEFRWQIENTGETAAKVAVMFTFQNGMGDESDAAGGHNNQPFALDGAQGVLLRHHYVQVQTVPPEERKTRLNGSRARFEDPLSFAIATEASEGVEVSYQARFDPAGSGADVWKTFSEEGRLANTGGETSSQPGERIAAAVAVTVEVPAGETREVAFALAWDMPTARFGFGVPYQRRYASFYKDEGPSSGNEGSAAPRMAADALKQSAAWEEAIEEWQAPILNDSRLPLWYRQALFNELYYVVDGGTIWASAIEGADPDPEMGRFAYLEGLEYRMYNTYDVHFYASFALAMNWPRLELALQRDMAAATLADQPDLKKEVYTGKMVPRKLAGATPHDVGWPGEDPWNRLNGYFLHDVNDWKDLNSKFVLQVFRDFNLTNDLSFAREMWPAVEAALRHLNQFDRDGDGLIENGGFPDQTYDVWSVKGPSAYTAGLWLAALQAGACLADTVGEVKLSLEYRRLYEKGKKSYQEKLWNGRYFNYDSSRSRQHDSIMADQLAGQWYARACGLDPIVEPLMARATLATIFDWNVQRFAGGTMGAVNGMRPDGRVDRTSMQSKEVWTGTTYALAAAMIQEGMAEAGFNTAWGVYKTTYEETGYWFQTPEAWNEQGDYRAIAYMRPLAIWAMQWAIERVR